MSHHLLEVDDLFVRFPTAVGLVQAVRGVSFTIDRGEAVGLVGESGSGKTVTANAIMGLIEAPGEVTGGDIRWKGESLQDPVHLRKSRGKEIAMIPQNPMRSLNPLAKIGNQISEVLRFHRHMSRQDAKAAAVELLADVGISAPQRRIEQYPHELSGGMCQRVLIALALAARPELLVADEPTTSLDVTIQAQIVDLLVELRQEMGLSVLFITHDLGLVAELCDTVQVAYSGRIVEHGPVRTVFSGPRHPYTAALLQSRPLFEANRGDMDAIPGMPPNPLDPPPGCAFHPRCSYAVDACRVAAPPLTIDDDADERRSFACYVPLPHRRETNAKALS